MLVAKLKSSFEDTKCRRVLFMLYKYVETDGLVITWGGYKRNGHILNKNKYTMCKMTDKQHARTSEFPGTVLCRNWHIDVGN